MVCCKTWLNLFHMQVQTDQIVISFIRTDRDWPKIKIFYQFGTNFMNENRTFPYELIKDLPFLKDFLPFFFPHMAQEVQFSSLCYSSTAESSLLLPSSVTDWLELQIHTTTNTLVLAVSSIYNLCSSIRKLLILQDPSLWNLCNYTPRPSENISICFPFIP